jgi:type IV secretion system protein VirB6
VSDHSQVDYATASEAMSMAANGLFIASAGLIAVVTIAIGLLTATGPLFIATFLFFETRGLFVGWVRALAASAFGLMSGWSLTVLMLHAVNPWMDALSDVGATVHDERAHATAAGMLYARREGSRPVAASPVRIGDSYRRPAVTRDGRRA